MDLSELPPELIGEILKHLDAISLARSRQVCRLWRSLHNNPKFKVLWKRACIEDIPQDALTELTGIKYLFASECPSGVNGESKNIEKEGSDIDWKDIYQEWYRSRHIGKWPCLINELIGHKGPVWDAKFSGDRVITCGEDSTIRIWDSWTKHCLKILSGHLAGVLSVSLRQTSGSFLHLQVPHDLIVSGSKDNALKVWDLRNSGTCLLTLHGHTQCVNSVTVQGNIAASASDDCSVKIWDICKGICLHTLSNLGDWTKFVCLWHNMVLSVTDNSCLGLWSVSSGESLTSIKLLNTRDMAFNSFPRTPGVQGAILRGLSCLVITYSDGLYVWEPQASLDESSYDSCIVLNFPLIGHHTNNVQRGECLAMRGALVAVGMHSGSVYVYHLNGEWGNQFKKVHCVIPGSKTTVNAVALDDDGEGPSLLTAGEDGIVRVYRWFPPSTLES